MRALCNHGGEAQQGNRHLTSSGDMQPMAQEVLVINPDWMIPFIDYLLLDIPQDMAPWWCQGGQS